MFSVLDMTDLYILFKIVALFSPTSSFTAWLTSAEYHEDVKLFHLVARIFLSQFPH